MSLSNKKTLSPKDLARAVGVSESSVKRWADEGVIQVARTAGGHRRITVVEAVRYIRVSGLPIVDPAAMGISDLTRVPAEHLSRPDSSDQPLVDAISDGQAELARGLVLSMYLGGRSVAEICDGPVTRAMHGVGDLWKHSSTGIIIEHRAMDICLQALNQLRALLPSPADAAPIATGGTPEGDPYLLPTLMAATVLAAEGWREENLGPSLPLELMTEAARKHQADLLWLSVSVELPTDVLAAQIVELGAKLAGMDVVLAVGGRMLPPRPMILKQNVNVIGSMSELAAFARGLQTARRETVKV
jgi:excisionase family DNA binding protein